MISWRKATGVCPCRRIRASYGNSMEIAKLRHPTVPDFVLVPVPDSDRVIWFQQPPLAPPPIALRTIIPTMHASLRNTDSQIGLQFLLVQHNRVAAASMNQKVLKPTVNSAITTIKQSCGNICGIERHERTKDWQQTLTFTSP